MMKLTFEKEQTGWYVVLPEYEGDKADLQMVLGADTTLDMLSGESDTVTLLCDTEYFDGCNATLELVKDDDIGADYVFQWMDDEEEYKLWLCPVTLFVFGDYPKTIYVEKI